MRRFNHESPKSEEAAAMGDAEDELSDQPGDEQKPLRARIRFSPEIERKEFELTVDDEPTSASELGEVVAEKAPIANGAPIGTRLTMTSRTGYFQDRIIPPSMVSTQIPTIAWAAQRRWPPAPLLWPRVR